MAKVTVWDKIRNALGFDYSKKTIEAMEADKEEFLRVMAEARLKHLEEQESLKEAATVEEPKPKAKAKSPVKSRAPRVVAFDPNAKDGDGDGIVQDGTIHARPATAKKTNTRKK